MDIDHDQRQFDRDREAEELALAWESLGVEIREIAIPLDATSKDPIRVDVSRIALAAPVVAWAAWPFHRAAALMD